MMCEKEMLHEHGTQLMQLTPGSIIYAADHDLKLRARKLAGEAEKSLPYAFMSGHVRRAASVVDLLATASSGAGSETAKRSAKLNTRLIYADRDLLKRAYEEAKRRMQ